eukprot:scaffold22536_cov18-Prasinocladus_malaysianus.AAC.1
MSNKQLIEMGRRDIKEIDEGLDRARRVVEDTINVGAQVGVAPIAASIPLKNPCLFPLRLLMAAGHAGKGLAGCR